MMRCSLSRIRAARFCPIAFRGYACIPVVIRISGILQFNLLQPGVLTRRLIKVGVNANVFHFVAGDLCI